MRTTMTIALALAAGFLGGLVSRCWMPAPVYAQTQAPPPAEILARKFVLVDENGKPRGVFGIEANGSPAIEITNGHGHAFTARWEGAGGLFDVHTPPYPPHKPTLLP